MKTIFLTALFALTTSASFAQSPDLTPANDKNSLIIQGPLAANQAAEPDTSDKAVEQRPGQLPITFNLKTPGRVSLAVYDERGRRIRELLRADPRVAGIQTIWWDGLDREGRPQAGEFEWRLAQSQGLKSEYLLSIGTSFREHHWPAQHGAMCGVETDGARIFATSAMSEGMPQTAAITSEGEWKWVSGPVGGWMGGIDLALDKDNLYFLGGPHCRDAGLYVQDPATGEIRSLPGMVNWGGTGPKNWSVEKYDGPRRISARDGDLVLASPGGLIVWLDPKTGTETARTTVKGGELADITSIGGGKVLALVGNALLEVSKDGKVASTPLNNLTSPRRLTVDPITGRLFIAQGGTSGQVLRFSPAYQLEKTFGREGGRQRGVYVATDFQEVTGISGDGTGGFVVVEGIAPRRTSHFDAEGKVRWEWYGGQGFYTPVVAERDNPNRVWLASMGELIYLEVDYAAKTWKPLATYAFDGALDRDLTTGALGNAGFGVKRLDLNGDGKLETYIWPKWSSPIVLRVDEEAGLLRPVATMDPIPATFATQPKRTLTAELAERPLGSDWGFQADVLCRLFNAHQEGEFEVLDGNRKVIASLLWYRGDHKPGVTTDAGHGNYMVFNGQEVMNHKSPEWPLTANESPVRISVANGRASLVFGDPGSGKSVAIERPVMEGSDGRPAAIELRTKQGATLAVKNASISFRAADGTDRVVPVPLEDSKWTQDPAQPTLLAEAIKLQGEDPENPAVRQIYKAFSWTDGAGGGAMDGKIEPQEIRLSKLVTPSSVLDIDDHFNVSVQSNMASGPDYLIYSPVEFTKEGFPVWDWNQSKSGPETIFDQTRSLWTDTTGNRYQTSAYTGDGYNHHWQWPATFVNATAVVKTAPDGTILWQSGERSGRGAPSPTGQMHYPINTLGVVHGCIGFSDYIEHPAEFWTEDGLYVGGLFDKRADDGLHPRVYAWFRKDLDQGDDWVNNLGLLQYDMLLGGSLIERPSGEVLYFAAGWNNSPVFRVTGWDEIQRQQGRITAPSTVRSAQRKGKGLRAEYFASATFDGSPFLVRTDERLWLSEKSWPDQSALAKAATIRWNGSIEPVVSGEHTFSAYTSDAGVRLWIDGRKVIDQWSTPGKYWAEPIRLEAGQRYSVRIDWRRRGDKPEMHLNWEALDLPIEHVPATALYPDTATTSLSEKPVKAIADASIRHYDEVLDVRNEADTLALGVEGSQPRWELSGRFIFAVANGGNTASIELLDPEGRAIVSCYMYRGEAKPGVTRPRGHTNYLVFNDAEVDLDDAQWRAIGAEQAFSITVEKGVARLTHVSGLKFERPVLSGDASRPATLQVRSNADAARVRASDLKLQAGAKDVSP